MASAFSATIVEIQNNQVIVANTSGERWSIPLESILGQPVLNQPLFLIAAAPGSDSHTTHPLAQAVAQYLLSNPSA